MSWQNGCHISTAANAASAARPFPPAQSTPCITKRAPWRAPQKEEGSLISQHCPSPGCCPSSRRCRQPITGLSHTCCSLPAHLWNPAPSGCPVQGSDSLRKPSIPIPGDPSTSLTASPQSLTPPTWPSQNLILQEGPAEYLAPYLRCRCPGLQLH